MSRRSVLHVRSGQQAGLSMQEAQEAYRDLVSRRLARRRGVESVPNWRPLYMTPCGAFTNIAGMAMYSGTREEFVGQDTVGYPY